MIANLVTSVRIALLAPLLYLLTRPDPLAHWTALGLFLLAGLTDVVDGRLARALNQASRLGALLDLIADRLLTLTVLAGLIAGGAVQGPFFLAGVALLARDLVVASLGEAAPDLGVVVTPLEKVKIAAQMLAFGLLIAPEAFSLAGLAQHDLGRGCLALAAALACWTTASYARRAKLLLSASRATP